MPLEDSMKEQKKRHGKPCWTWKKYNHNVEEMDEGGVTLVVDLANAREKVQLKVVWGLLTLPTLHNSRLHITPLPDGDLQVHVVGGKRGSTSHAQVLSLHQQNCSFLTKVVATHSSQMSKHTRACRSLDLELSRSSLRERAGTSKINHRKRR